MSERKPQPGDEDYVDWKYAGKKLLSCEIVIIGGILIAIGLFSLAGLPFLPTWPIFSYIVADPMTPIMLGVMTISYGLKGLRRPPSDHV